jgi:hypothetical protein
MKQIEIKKQKKEANHTRELLGSFCNDAVAMETLLDFISKKNSGWLTGGKVKYKKSRNIQVVWQAEKI